MPTLASELRNKLERVVIEARDATEAGARAALEALAVHHHEPYPHMKQPAPARAAQPPPRAGAATWGHAGRLRPVRHRPPGRRVRLRTLAPDAVRPVPGRERPAHRAAGEHGHQPGRGRGTGQGRRRGRVGLRLTLRSADAAADLPAGRPAAPGLLRHRAHAPARKAAGVAAAGGLYCLRRAGVGLPVLAEQEEG